jgi:iron(III) transport system permease protein
MGSLARNTLQLVAGTLLVVLPAGVLGAILLQRTDLPFRRALQLLILCSLFVPLPLLASGWQAAFGINGWLQLEFWNQPVSVDAARGSAGVLYRPWASGLGSAIWVQAMAGLPWVIAIVGLGLSWVEEELEEEMLLVAGPWSVLWHVTLPGARISILSAALWVSLQACTEIAVSDVMQVRTYAEEVYTQLLEADQPALARALVASLPLVILCLFLILAAVGRWQKTLPPLFSLQSRPVLFRLHRARWPAFALVCLVALAVFGLPVGSLIRRAGLAGSPSTWSFAVLAHHVNLVLRTRGSMVLTSVGLALGGGIIAAAYGLVICWLSQESTWFRISSLVLLALVWAMPGPIIGIGLIKTIELLLTAFPVSFLENALYRSPSPLPALWVDVLRFLPLAVAMLWPAVRLLPPELRDTARVEGATPWQELRHVIWPLTRRSFLGAAFAVMVLSLGEISAGKLVETPGFRTFTQAIFDQMHYGVGNDLAVLCLVLLGIVGLGCALMLAAGFGWRSLAKVLQ